jgi:hypothetical protein
MQSIMKILSHAFAMVKEILYTYSDIFKGNTSAKTLVVETEVPMTGIEETEVIEEDSDQEVAVASMTEETIVTDTTEEITIKIDLEVHLQGSMIDHQEGKYLLQINIVLLDLEVHQDTTTLAPEGADQDPEDKENVENALTLDSVASLESSMATEAETSATGETWETKSTMVQRQETTDPMTLAHQLEWGRRITLVAPETSHQENLEINKTCLQEVVTAQEAIAMVAVSEKIDLLEDSTIADLQEAADSNPEVASETTADQEATSEVALVVVIETWRKKESWKRVSASFASNKATWPEIALKVASNVREAASETEEVTSQEAMETMTESDLSDYHK